VPLLSGLPRDYVGRMRGFDRFHSSRRKSASASEHRLEFEEVSSDLPVLQQTAKASQRFQDGERSRRKGKRGINPRSKPSGTGCVECLAGGSWWLQLRRCAECGLIGCCDSSPHQHAMKHARSAGHPIVASFEPLQNWFYDYEKGKIVRGMKLLPPRSHPELQTVPGPPGKVPANWRGIAQ
jgi:Zn-finger in ubiquitin-hydrolases and other protein